MTEFLLYLVRWQLSTPILALFTAKIRHKILASVLANLVGGCVFYFVDRWIFR